VPDGGLRTAVLDGRYVVDYVTPEGAQVLLPLKDRVSTIVNDVFETGQALPRRKRRWRVCEC